MRFPEPAVDIQRSLPQTELLRQLADDGTHQNSRMHLDITPALNGEEVRKSPADRGFLDTQEGWLLHYAVFLQRPSPGNTKEPT